MTGKKDLNEMAGIIKNCFLFIGIDSGFAHIANAYEKNAVILIGEFAGFKNYMPYSGKFQNEKENTIIYHSDPLKSLSCTAVLSLLEKKLNP